jgi:predicted permease
MNGLGREFREALRLFRRQPVLALSVTVTLGIGIAFSVVLFGLLYAFAFRAPDVRDPGSLVAVYTADYDGPSLGGTSYPDLLAFQQGGEGVVSLAATTRISSLLVHRDEVVPVTGAAVSGNYFSLLGLVPHAGRLLQPADDRLDAPPAAVISHDLWRRRLGGDSGVVGGTLILGEFPFTIVGIGPPGFGGVSLDVAAEVWISAAHRALVTREATTLAERRARIFHVIGRLTPGATLERARSVLDLMAARLQAEYPEDWTDGHGQRRAVTVLDLRKSRLAGNPEAVTALVGGLVAVVGLVLLVVSTNVASLLLAHAAGRRREVSIRAALGASRGRLARQRIVETLALATAGGGLGLLGALTCLEAVDARWPEGIPRLTLALDVPVVSFTLALVLLATVLAGAAPAVQTARVGLASALGEPAPIRRGRGGGLRGALIAGQLGVSSALLVVTGLLLRSSWNATRIDPGFSARDVVTALLELPASYDSVTASGFFTGVMNTLAADPAVLAVTPAWIAPQSGSRVTATVVPDGAEPWITEVVGIGPRYFEVLSIPLVAGRGLTPAEAAGGSAAVVSETLARRLWPDGALGRTLRFERGSPLEIVGVARDAALFAIDQPHVARAFVPFGVVQRTQATILLKTSGPASAARDAVRRAVRQVGPTVALAAVEPLPQVMARQTAPQRALAALGAAAGGLELLLASLALAGLVAYWTAQRTREIGLRVALGATRREVVRGVMAGGLRLAAAGVAVGLVAALLAQQVVRSMLVGIGSFEPRSFAAVALVLSAVAALATYLPARRAARIDPMEALRCE